MNGVALVSFPRRPFTMPVNPRDKRGISVIVALGIFLLSAIRSLAGEALSQLEVLQPITSKGQVYTVTPGLKISFNLAVSANVTVEIRRHLSSYGSFKWPWLQEPFLVRAFPLGQLPAGPHTLDWDGMDEKGQPVSVVRNSASPLGNSPKPTRTEQLVETVPVNYLQVVVKAGNEQLKANFERSVGILQPNRMSLPFRMGTLDKEGHFLIADFPAWSVYRYTPDFVQELDRVWPKDNSYLGGDPGECSRVHVDSQGHILIGNVLGVYRYNPDGYGAPWTHPADYIPNFPNGIILGNKTPDVSKYSHPGFANGFAGFTVDEKDNIYLVGQTPPTSFIEVFGPDGSFLRKLPVPAGKNAGEIAWAGNNTLAVALNGSLVLLDATTGAVKKSIPDCPANFAQTDLEGNIYAGPNLASLYRYTPAGDPLPFNPALPNVKGNHLMLSAGEAGVPAGSAGFPAQGIQGLAFAADGSFYASEAAGYASVPGGLLHYAKDGTFLADSLGVKWGCQTLANVYLDDAPATMQLLVTNFTNQKQPFTVHWTLTDFDGKKTSGDVPLTAEPLAVQSVPFTMDMPEMGHYQVDAEIRQGLKFVEKLAAQAARIPSRPIFTDRYSPFAVVFSQQAEVMALAGAKSSRGDSLSWKNVVEPLDGVFYGEHPDVPQFPQNGPESQREFVRKYGFLNLNGLDYGEPWLDGSTNQIYSYDRFYQYCLHCIDLFAGKGEAFYQFWNEPNFFWRYGSQDPFAREQFALVQQHVWSMIKARDKNVLSLADGDAGSVEIMQNFFDWGASGYTDTVETHYPAATPLAFNNMQVPDLPETKAVAIQKLVDLRDKLYPGKQIFNTEENIPDSSHSAEIAATNLPRVEIPQLAVGVDKIYQFSQTSVQPNSLHDVTCFLDENGEPFPTYVTYATMTRLLDGDVFAGKVDFAAPGTYGYLFARAKDFVLVANSISGNIDVTIAAGVPSVEVVDLVGRSHRVATVGGNLKLTLSPRVQYVILPRSGPAQDLARTELKRELDSLQVSSAADIPAQMAAAVKAGPSDLASLNRLYHLVKAAEVAEAAGENLPAGNLAETQKARAMVESHEGPDGYMRQSRVALDFAEHLAQIAGHDPSMSWPALLAAQMTEALASLEAPAYPGVVINAYIGEPGTIEKIRATIPVADKPETGIDNQFRFQIDRKPGDAFELELTVYDYYQHPLNGTVVPRLPDGWQVTPSSATYSVAPGKLQRFMFTVTIPAEARPGIFSLGGETTCNGATVQELHAQRIKL